MPNSKIVCIGERTNWWPNIDNELGVDILLVEINCNCMCMN